MPLKVIGTGFGRTGTDSMREALNILGVGPGDRAHALGLYEANVAAVKATVPPSRLLVHNLGDGWEPLCKHLGVAVPDAPYPSRNSTDDFKRAILAEPTPGGR